MPEPYQTADRSVELTTAPSVAPSLAPNTVGIADMARSLVATLQAAPVRESRQAVALRQHLTKIARELAELAGRARSGEDFDAAIARLLVEQIRHIATDLAISPPAVPIGIDVVLQAFAAQLLPETLLILRPTGQFHYPFREDLFLLHALAEKLHLTAADPAVPRKMLILRYPQGEQDNVLLSCNLLRAFRPHRAEQDVTRSDTFATWLLGPAYFFAFATEVERSDLSHSTEILDQLRYVAGQLREAGWCTHPQIGPLLQQWKARLGLDDSTMVPPVPALLLPATEQEKETVRELMETSQYLPADFDRDVPRLWARLRQLLPPNDLELESIESTEPADVVSILNAGWSFALLHLDDLYQILGSRTAEDRYEASQVLNRLLTKGVELSHIARLWRNARE